MKDSSQQSSLFLQQQSFNPNSLLALLPYIPERGYVGTNNDRRKFLEMSRVCKVRPAYLVRLVERWNGYHSFYTLMVNCNSFQHVRDKIAFDYRDKKYMPEIRFIAQLMPLPQEKPDE